MPDVTQPTSEPNYHRDDANKLIAQLRQALDQALARCERAERRVEELEDAHDPIKRLARMNDLADRFEASHPRMYCPSCRKRVSPRHSAVDAGFNNERVRMVCGHCEHRWEVDRAAQPEPDTGGV